MKKAFNFLLSYHRIINDLETDKQKLDIFMAITKIQFLEVKVEDISFSDKFTKLAFSSIKHSLESSVEGYLSKVKEGSYIGVYAKDYTPCQGGSEGSIEAPARQEKEKEKEKEEVRPITLSPINIINAYKENVSTDRTKIDEKWTMQELRNIKHDYHEIINGLINYGKKVKGTDNIQKLSNFISNKVYLDYQIEKKEELMQGLMYQGSIYA